MPTKRAKNSRGIWKRGKFLSLQEVANEVGVHKETVRRWIAEGMVKVEIYTSDGGLWVVREADAEKFNDSIKRAKNSKGIWKRGRFLSLQEVADEVGVHKETVRRWITEGKVKVDIYTAERGLWVVRASDAEKFKAYAEG